MRLGIFKRATWTMLGISCAILLAGCAPKPPRVPPNRDLGSLKEFGCVCAKDPKDPANQLLIIGRDAYAEAVYTLVEVCKHDPDKYVPRGTLDSMECECRLIRPEYREEFYVTDQYQVSELIIQISQCLTNHSS